MFADKIKSRMAYIENLLFWEGDLSRKDLTQYFNISIPQATKDIGLYIENAQNNLFYDHSEKKYVATTEFNPILVKPNSEAYLQSLLSQNCDSNSKMFEYGHTPPFYSLPSIKRTINTDILKTILHCIHSKRALEVEYQSMNNPSPTVRWIVPCAFGFDGKRWHIRVYSYKDNDFKDYNLSRILSTGSTRGADIDFNLDLLWHTNVEFIIAPHPKHSEGAKKVLELDYNMKNSILNLEVKAAFIYYIKKQFCFDYEQWEKDPKDQQLILLNLEEIDAQEKLLIKMTKEKLS